MTENGLILDGWIDLPVGRAAVLRFLDGSLCPIAVMTPWDRAGAVGRLLSGTGDELE